MAFIGSILTTGSFTGAHKQIATLKSSGGGGGTDSESAHGTDVPTSGSFDLVIQTGDIGNNPFRGTSGSLRIDVKNGGSYLRALRIGAGQYGSFIQTGNASLNEHKFTIVTPTQVEYMRVDPANTATVFNEGSADLDFRVESNNLSHMFFIDGGENQAKIGYGTTETANTLTLLHNDSDGQDGFQIVRSDTTTAENDWLGGIGFDSTDGNVPSSVKEASAYIGAHAAEDFGSGDKGGYLVIGTSALDENEDTVSTERFRVGPDSLVQVSGTLRVRDDVVVGGTVYHTDDEDTYRQFGVNTQIFVVGGTERLRLNSNGASIGGATPAENRDLTVGSSTGARISLRDTGASSESDTLAYVDFYQGQSTKQIGWVGFGSTTHSDLQIYNRTTSGNVYLSGTSDIYLDAGGSNIFFRAGNDTMARLDIPKGSTSNSANTYFRFGYGGLQGDARFLLGDTAGDINGNDSQDFIIGSHSYLYDSDYDGVDADKLNYVAGVYGDAPEANDNKSLKTQNVYPDNNSIYPSDNTHLVAPLCDYAVNLDYGDSFRVFWYKSETFRASETEFYVYFQFRLTTTMDEPNDEVIIYFLNTSGGLYNALSNVYLEVDGGGGNWISEAYSSSNHIVLNNVNDYDDSNWRWARLRIPAASDIADLAGIEIKNTADAINNEVWIGNLMTRAVTNLRHMSMGLLGLTQSDLLSTGGSDWEIGTLGLTTSTTVSPTVDNGSEFRLYAPPTGGRARFLLNYFNSSTNSHASVSALTFMPNNDSNGTNGTYGHIGVWDTSPDYNFDVLGDMNASGEVRNSGSALSSDERLKENIEDMPDMLDKVNQLQPRLFDWKEGARVGRLDTESYRLRDFGFIAQEMSTVLPNMVSVGQDSEKLQGINYGKLTSVLVKAIQELNQKVVDLQAEVDSLKQ